MRLQTKLAFVVMISLVVTSVLFILFSIGWQHFIDNNLHLDATFLILLLIIAFIPTFAVTYYFIRVNRRIKKLNTSIQKADLNHLSLKGLDKGKDEIGQLAQLFHAMSLKLSNQVHHIQQIEKARKTLISHLSHDLRTPLTSIKGYAETIYQGKSIRESDIRRYSMIIVQRSEYMEHLINQLFEIAMLDRMPTTLKKSSCNISKVVQQIIMDYVYILEDKNIEADIHIPATPLWVNMDERDVNQIIRNLVENAIHHGEDGHYLGIDLQEMGKIVQLKIMDKGRGIPEDEKERIFEPFYRIDKGRKSIGLGVGLAITKEIVERHQGNISVESKPFDLTTFTVELPCLTLI